MTRFLTVLPGVIGAITGPVGIYFAWQSIYLTSQIESLKIRPYLDYTIDISQNPFVEIKNHGQYAALIESIYFSYDNTKVDVSTKLGLEQFLGLEIFDPLNSGEKGLALGIPSRGGYIGPNESVKLVFVHDSYDTSYEFRRAARNVVNGLTTNGSFDIEYCSIDTITCDSLKITAHR